MKSPIIKICGITNVDDALHAAESGCTAIGLNFYPGSPRYIQNDDAYRIAEAVRGKVDIVGVFVNEKFETILSLKNELHLDCLQLHGYTTILPTLSLSNVIHAVQIDDTTILEDISNIKSGYLLLDSYKKNSFGGTGITFNWSVARNIFGHSIIIAGGLTADNVQSAIKSAMPSGVDVSSGVESYPGKKDPLRVKKFIHNAAEAFLSLESKIK